MKRDRSENERSKSETSFALEQSKQSSISKHSDRKPANEQNEHRLRKMTCCECYWNRCNSCDDVKKSLRRKLGSEKLTIQQWSQVVSSDRRLRRSKRLPMQFFSDKKLRSRSINVALRVREKVRLHNAHITCNESERSRTMAKEMLSRLNHRLQFYSNLLGIHLLHKSQKLLSCLFHHSTK